MKPGHVLTVTFLILVAVAHVLRLIFGWDVEVNQLAIPMWPSVLAMILTLGLAVALIRESRAPKV